MNLPRERSSSSSSSTVLTLSSCESESESANRFRFLSVREEEEEEGPALSSIVFPLFILDRFYFTNWFLAWLGLNERHVQVCKRYK